jgi:FAD:protein FMN transferase
MKFNSVARKSTMEQPAEYFGASRLRPGMGTFLAVEAQGREQNVKRGIHAAYAAMTQVETLMHPTRAGSDLHAIAEASPGQSIAVHPWTWDVLLLCKQLHADSAGLFDPCLPRCPGQLSAIELPRHGLVEISARVAVDLGGIAKGYAVDRAVMALMEAGCHSGLVNAGGDLRVFGPRDFEIWVDGAPRRLRNSALAVSRRYLQDRPAEHQGYYSRVAVQSNAAASATVLADSAAIADALTKCVLLAPLADTDNLLRRYHASSG